MRLNILKYLSLLKFSLRNPNVGAEIFQTLREYEYDRKNKTHEYKAEPSNVINTLEKIFPDFDFTFEELQNKLLPLHNHLKDFFTQLDSVKYPSREKPYPIDYSLNEQAGVFLYALCKKMKPEKIFETGVAYGLSSSYILQALDENKKGELYSIDSIFRPWESKEMIGSAIPAHLKYRWKFIFGKSSNKLENLLNSLEKIDIFFHDSLHTVRNMMFEFNTTWPFLKENGILVADDIVDNDAFYQFYSSKSSNPFFLTNNDEDIPILGILMKNYS